MNNLVQDFMFHCTFLSSDIMTDSNLNVGMDTPAETEEKKSDDDVNKNQHILNPEVCRKIAMLSSVLHSKNTRFI